MRSGGRPTSSTRSRFVCCDTETIAAAGLHVLDREAEDLQGDGRDRNRTDPAVGEREEDDVVTCDDGAPRVDCAQ